MNKPITTLLFILLACSSLWAQEQLTFIQSFANEGSNPLYVGNVNNKTIFTIHKPDTNKELWVTDGTEAGTFFISNTVPVIQTANVGFANGPTNVVSKFGYLYFEVAPTTTSTYPELWRTDGTPSGTTKVLDVNTEIPNSPDRRIYLLTSDSFFFIAINSRDERVEINKYSNDFLLIDRILQPKACYPARPYILKETPFIDCLGVITSSTLKGEIERDGNVYQFFEKAQNQTSSRPDLTVAVFDGAYSKGFPTIDRTNFFAGWDPFVYEQGFSKYFEYKGQMYALYVGGLNHNTGMRHLTVELYLLTDTSVKLKSGLITEPSIYDIESIWLDQSMLHIITREKNYSGNSSIVFKQHKIDIEKEYPAARSVKVIFEGDRGDVYAKNSEFVFFKKDRQTNEKFIYHQESEKIILVNEEVNIASLKVYKNSPDNYFIVQASNMPEDSKKGSEPYWYNSSTNSFKLLKDINTGSKGIIVDPYTNDFALKTNPLLWTSVENKGVILYKSDGTKEGTKPLKTLSSIPYSSWEKRGQNGNYYGFAYDIVREETENCQYCIYSEKSFTFISDGTEGGTHVTERLKGYGNPVSFMKINDDYYSVYKKAGIDTVVVAKTTADGKTELVREINGQGFISVHQTEDDLVLQLVELPGGVNMRFMSALTGKEVKFTGPIPIAWSGPAKRFVYGKYDTVNGKTDVFTYEKGSILKLVTLNGYQVDYRFINSGYQLIDNDYQFIVNEIVFYDIQEQKIWAVDLKTAHVTEIPVLFKNYKLESISKTDGAYYSHFSNLSGGSNKTQLFKNNIASEILIPSEIDNPFYFGFGNYKVFNNTPYFFHYGTHSKGEYPVTFDIYTVENSRVKIVASVGDKYEYFPSIQIGNAFFLNPNGKIVVWQKSGLEEIVEAGWILQDVAQIGSKYILVVRYPALNGGSGMYITDGTKAGTKLLGKFNTSFLKLNAIGNKVYFAEYTTEAGNEPWVTDGTPEGTTMVGDFWKGPQNSDPANFKDVDGVPVCLASTPDMGRQLFSLLTKLDAPLLAAPNTQACEGDTIVLTASKGFDTYKWIIDEGKEVNTTENRLNVTKSGTYKVIVSKDKASSHPSNAVSINFIPLPAKPIIKQENNQLSVTATGQLQWYLNGTAITGATTNILTYSGAGDYAVKVTENACSVLSDKLLVAITSTEELWANAVYPNPTTNKIIIKVNQNQSIQLKLIDLHGRTVLQKTLSDVINEIDLKDFAKGAYILRLDQATKKIIIE